MRNHYDKKFNAMPPSYDLTAQKKWLAFGMDRLDKIQNKTTFVPKSLIG